MRAPRNSAERADPKSPRKLEEDLDRSRKQKLWLRSNYLASALILAVLALAFMNMIADVRGEYGGNCESLGGMVICSVVHSDKKINATMIIPNTSMLVCNTSDENVGQNVDWTFTVAHPVKGATPVHFKGKIENNSMVGIIQDELKVFPVKLDKDLVASLLRQLRAFIPGAN